MALTEQQVDQALELEEPNEPAKLAMQGAGGKRPIVPVSVQRRRREALSQLLAAGTSTDGIIVIMSMKMSPDGKPGFGMTESAIRKLVREVYAVWQEEDAEAAQHYKSSAIRRLNRHINHAKDKGAWTAVAMMEKILMDMQGTAEPIEVNVTGEVRLTHSIMKVLGETDPIEVRKMIDSERARLQFDSDVIDMVVEES